MIFDHISMILHYLNFSSSCIKTGISTWLKIEGCRGTQPLLKFHINSIFSNTVKGRRRKQNRYNFQSI